MKTNASFSSPALGNFSNIIIANQLLNPIIMIGKGFLNSSARLTLLLLSFIIFSTSFISCKKDSDNTEVHTIPENGEGNDLCECVGYVKNQLAITCTGCTANAKDWGLTYFPEGFSLVLENPQIGDLLVITPAVGQHWSNSPAFLAYGHIGIVETFSVLPNGNLSIGIRGANQGGSQYDCGCSNVNLRTFILPIGLRQHIRVLRKVNPYVCFQIPPSAPNLLQPLNNAIISSLPISFSWQCDNGESRIQISTSIENWNASTGFADGLVVNQNVGFSKSFTLSSAENATIYYWSVRCFVNGLVSEFSQPQRFITGNIADTRIISLGGNLSFGTVTIGQSSDRILTISNSGNAALAINSISVPNGFTVLGSQNLNIPANQSQNVTIRFAPTNAANYSGLVAVNGNQTSGTNTMAISGNGAQASPSYIVTPNIGTYTALPSGNITGFCSVNPYLGNNIIMAVTNINSSTITFRIKKPTGDFMSDGTAYIKDSEVCGTILGSNTYSSGASYVNLNIPNELNSGQTKTYVGVVISTLGGVYRYYTLSITVKRNN